MLLSGPWSKSVHLASGVERVKSGDPVPLSQSLVSLCSRLIPRYKITHALVTRGIQDPTGVSSSNLDAGLCCSCRVDESASRGTDFISCRDLLF